MRIIFLDLYKYIISLSLGRLVGFLILPYLSFRLTELEFGYMSTFILIVNFMCLIISFGYETILIQKFDNFKTNNSYFFSNSLFYTLIITLFFLPLALFMMKRYGNEDYLFLTPIIIVLTFIASYIQNIFQMTNTYFQMLKMPGQILKYQIANVTTFIIILFITLDVLNTGWLSRVYALVAGLIIGTLLGLRYLKFNFQKDFIQNDFFKSNLGRSSYIVGSGILAFSIMNIDKFFVQKELGLFEFGIYSFGIVISQLIAFMSIAVNKTLTPYLIDISKKNNYPKFILYVLSKIVIMTILASVYLILIEKFFTILFDTKFLSIVDHLDIIFLTVIIFQCCSLSNLFLLSKDKNNFIFIINIAIFILTVFYLNIIVIDSLSIIIISIFVVSIINFVLINFFNIYFWLRDGNTN